MMAGSPARINRSAITGSWSIACWVIVALTSVALGRPVAGAAASIRVNGGSQSWSTAGHATCGADVATVISPAALAKLEPGSALGRRREYRAGGERVNRYRRFTYVAGLRHGGTTTTSITTNHIHGEGAYRHRFLFPSWSANSFAAENDPYATRGVAAANTFARTESMAGKASSRKVGEIAESMRGGGWKGDPIKIVEHNGQRYVIDGHHRLEAARRAGIDASFEVVSPAEMARYGYRSVDDVVRAASEVGPNRLR